MYSSPAGPRPATPRSLPSSADEIRNPHGGPERLMQVKVLYTFDDNNKTNCLARCPQPLNILTAFLDPAAEIGIIELRTCIQAIVGASPELIAKLGQDYTVYAYDYSEYETPLVGQGMLSWVLASSSSTPMAPANQSRTMVTGRVCKNILGLFSDGIKETLEVKLRLVPVPTCLQSEYLASMEKYRDASNMAMESFDPDTWSTFLRANPSFGIGRSDEDSRPASSVQFENMDDIFFEPMSDAVLAGLSNSSSQPFRTLLDLSNNNDARKDLENGRPGVPSYPEKPSRPSSRASNRSRQPTRRKPLPRVGSYQGQESAGLEEGPTRKRARTTKSDWQGPSPFATTSESLRVTASTAASIRGHCLLSHPTASDDAAGDSGIRPPTPRPQPALKRKQLGLARHSTSLAHEIVTRSDTYVSPYTSGTSGSGFTFPETPSGSIGSTPADMPSSPPVFQPRSPTRSSPALPMLPQYHDSGFMSGTPDDYLPEDEDELRPLDYEDVEMAARYKKRSDPVPSQLSITEETPGDPSLLPRKMLPRPNQQPSASCHTRKNRARIPATSSPRLCQTSKPLPESNLPQISSEMDKSQLSDAELFLLTSTIPEDEPIERSESCTSDLMLRVDVSGATADSKPPAARYGTGSSLKRKKAIQDRLASSIAAGEMPPFCRNCGEINTPTWRKAFVKIESGSPDSLQLSETEDGILAWEPVSKDADGKVTSYRVTRKIISLEEKGFEEVQLCNPCGIWLFKNRTMRPPEKWTKVSVPEPPKPKRRPLRKKSIATESRETQTERDEQQRNSADEQSEPLIRPSSPLDKPHVQRCSDSTESKASNSVCARNMAVVSHHLLEDAAAAAALHKAIQSSPPRFPGSKHSPIDLDNEVSSKMTRRLLFPSPRRPGEVKNLDGPSLDISGATRKACGITQHFDLFSQEDKENLAPVADVDDNAIDDLFETSETAATPRTPEAMPTADGPFKTPSSSSSKRLVLINKEFLSSGGKEFREPRTPGRGPRSEPLDMEQMTPFTAHITQLISEANYPPAEETAIIYNDGTSHHSGPFAFTGFVGGDLDVGAPTPGCSPTQFSLYEDPTVAGGGPWSEDSFFKVSVDVFLEQNKGTGEVLHAANSATCDRS